MSNPSFTGYVPFPMKIALERILQSEAFLKDVRNFVTIPENQFRQAIEALDKSSEFLGRERITAIVQEHIGDTEQASSLTSFILNFNALLREFDESPEGFVQLIEAQIPGTLPADDRQAVLSRLPDVVRRREGIERQAKAEEVIRRTKAHAHDLMLVCDLRPVFDSTGSRVEGFVPISTLRLVLHQNDKYESVEARLSEQQVHDLFRELSRAKQKLSALKEFVRTSGVALPETSATGVEEEE